MTRCGEFWLPHEVVRKLPMTERDRVRNRVFFAESYITTDTLRFTPHAAYRSVVSLLKYEPDMLLGPGARSVHGACVSDIEGVILHVRGGQVNDPQQSAAFSRISGRELEAAGMFRESDALERSVRDALPTGVC